VALDRTFAADRTWALLASLPVTRTFLASTMILAMRDVAGHARVPLESPYDLHAYELPEPLRGRALARFRDRFVYMYGLTEAQLTCAAPGEFAANPRQRRRRDGRVADPDPRRRDRRCR